MPEYDMRLILFLDFLGFSEIVAETADDPAKLQNLLHAMDRLGKIGETTGSQTQQITQFSDCIVASYEATEPSAVFELLNAIAFCVIDLLDMGYLVRGGVTGGQLLHNDRHLVGPAMIDAYRMESVKACVPRVLVDPELIEVARMFRSENHDPDDEEGYVRHFLTKDRDGEMYFDYVSHRSVVEVVGVETEEYPEYLAALLDHIRKGFAHTDLPVKAKYVWLQRQYAKQVTQISALEKDHPYRISEPESWSALASMPLLQDEADLILKDVRKAKLPILKLL